MKRRCLNRRSHNYKDYGGPGITMYPEWIESFDAFETWILANLGPRPEGHSLDRIDVNGGYEPGNLRWATAKEQRANQRCVCGRARDARISTQYATEYAWMFGVAA
jgi:hypothetical protein